MEQTQVIPRITGGGGGAEGGHLCEAAVTETRVSGRPLLVFVVFRGSGVFNIHTHRYQQRANQLQTGEHVGPLCGEEWEEPEEVMASVKKSQTFEKLT